MVLGVLERITEWLGEEELPYDELEDREAYFSLRIRYDGLAILVKNPRKKPGVVYVVTTLGLSGVQQSMFDENLDDVGKRRFLWDLRLRLLEEGLAFRMGDDVHRERWLYLQVTLYIEDLNRTMFMGALRRMSRTARLVAWLLERDAGFPKPKDEPPMMIG